MPDECIVCTPPAQRRKGASHGICSPACMRVMTQMDALDEVYAALDVEERDMRHGGEARDRMCTWCPGTSGRPCTADCYDMRDEARAANAADAEAAIAAEAAYGEWAWQAGRDR